MAPAAALGSSRKATSSASRSTTSTSSELGVGTMPSLAGASVYLPGATPANWKRPLASVLAERPVPVSATATEAAPVPPLVTVPVTR